MKPSYSSSKRSAYNSKIDLTSKMNELEEIEKKIKTNEDLACQLINQNKKYNPFSLEDLNKMKHQIKHILKYFNISQNDFSSNAIDLSQILTSKLVPRIQELDKRNKQIQELKNRIHEIEKQELSLTLPPKLCADDQIYNQFMEYLSQIHDLFQNFRIYQKEQISNIENLILFRQKQFKEQNILKKQKAAILFSQNNNRINELQKKKEELSNKLKEQQENIEYGTMEKEIGILIDQMKTEALTKIEDENRNLEEKMRREDEIENVKDQKEVIPDYLPIAKETYSNPSFDFTKEDIDQIISKRKKHFLDFSQKIYKYANSQKFNNMIDDFVISFNQHSDDLQRKCSNLNSKILKTSQIFQEIQKKRTKIYSKEKSNQACKMLNQLMKAALMTTIVQKPMNAIGELLKPQTEKLQAQIQREKDNQGKIIGDSGLTLSEMRKEIRRLEREIGQENLEGEAFIRQVEKEIKSLQSSQIS